ncbi:MAG: dCTP deaminase, partial [Alphaproteobacteria bacterium]|nr:dCTP deaminase [Alphaproteobacteria bacterium]
MPVMPDTWIRKMATDHAMISPFTESQRRDGVISYGVSSYGYDARVADEFKIFTNVDAAMLDPKDFSDQGFV